MPQSLIKLHLLSVQQTQIVLEVVLLLFMKEHAVVVLTHMEMHTVVCSQVIQQV